MIELLDFVKTYWWILMTVGGFIWAIYKFIKIGLPELIRNQKKIQKRLEELEKEIEGKIKQGDCEVCKQHICKQVEAIGKRIDLGEKKRDDAKEKNDERFQGLANKLSDIGGQLKILVKASRLSR